MALQLVRFQRKKQPLLNEPLSHNNLLESNFRFLAKTLFNRVRNTPELVAMLDTVVTDHFLGPVDFFDTNDQPLGPTKMKKIKKLWEDQNVQGHAFYGQGLDLFIDGSSFGWHVTADILLTTKQKEAIARIKAINPEIGNFAVEESNMPKVISYLAASTTEIKHDDQGILFYIQDAAGQRIRWNKEQVVHVKLMEFNGEVRGFSALKALTKEIVQMYMLKDNIIAKLQNGGTADNIISIEGINGGVNRKRFERLRTALESFSHLKKSHGNMPIDAKVTVHPLGVGLKDMEYRELAMFLISEFALALGLPTSRIPFMMTGGGGVSNKGELSGNSEDSYQTKINSRRKNMENNWNKVFRKAGFTYRFRRDNLQDDVRETMASTQRVAWVSGMQQSLRQANKQFKINSHLALLSGKKMDISLNDIEPLESMELTMGGAVPGSIGTREQPSQTASRGRVIADNSAAKKMTATNDGVFA